jgi:hypothetical protein
VKGHNNSCKDAIFGFSLGRSVLPDVPELTYRECAVFSAQGEVWLARLSRRAIANSIY